MTTIDKLHTPTKMTEDEAYELAFNLNEDPEEDWSYFVEPFDDGYAVAVYEDNERIGLL